MWSSEPIPFDAMEIALHEAYAQTTKLDERSNFKMVHEYPLEGRPPMMTHIFKNNSETQIIATKGAPEAIMACSQLSEIEKQQIITAMNTMAKEGFRVLGVGSACFEGNNYPEKQQDFTFVFKGLVAFYDPPKKNIKSVFETFYKAGIQVKIITGDNAATTSTIAKQIGFKDYDKTVNGDELMVMDEATLHNKVMETAILLGCFPKLNLKLFRP